MDKDSVWERIRKGLKDGASMSIEKIEEYTKIGKLKVEEMAAGRKIDRNHMDIGARVVALLDEGKASEIEGDLTVRKGVENVKALREELESITEKIREVSEEAKRAEEARKSKADETEDDVTGV